MGVGSRKSALEVVRYYSGDDGILTGSFTRAKEEKEEEEEEEEFCFFFEI